MQEVMHMQCVGRVGGKREKVREQGQLEVMAAVE